MENRVIKFEYLFQAKSGTRAVILTLEQIEKGELLKFKNQLPVTFNLIAKRQFIGILDCKEDEVYDGDMVRDVHGDVFKVVFHEGGFKLEEFYIASQDNPLDAFSGDYTYEIIGNIYTSEEE